MLAGCGVIGHTRRFQVQALHSRHTPDAGQDFIGAGGRGVAIALFQRQEQRFPGRDNGSRTEAGKRLRILALRMRLGGYAAGERRCHRR